MEMSFVDTVEYNTQIRMITAEIWIWAVPIVFLSNRMEATENNNEEMVYPAQGYSIPRDIHNAQFLERRS